MSTDMLEDTRIDEKVDVTDSGDHDTFSHYARMSDIERSTFDGVEITALCGKKWRPAKDFSKYPVCPTCKDIYESLPKD